MNRAPWRDPILLVPLLVIGLAAGVFALTWRQFTQQPPTPPSTLTPTARASDPAAVEFLKNMEASMNRLSSLKAVQTLRDDDGHTVVTTMLYTTPGSLYLETSSGEQSVVMGGQQWARGPKDSMWQEIQRVKPFVFPDFHDYSPTALEVQFGGEAPVNGEAARVVTFSFFTSTGPIEFAVFGDPQTLRFRRVTMEAPGHHMVTDFVDYAPVVNVTAPPPAEVGPTATP